MSITSLIEPDFRGIGDFFTGSIETLDSTNDFIDPRIPRTVIDNSSGELTFRLQDNRSGTTKTVILTANNKVNILTPVGGFVLTDSSVEYKLIFSDELQRWYSTNAIPIALEQKTDRLFPQPPISFAIPTAGWGVAVAISADGNTIVAIARNESPAVGNVNLMADTIFTYERQFAEWVQVPYKLKPNNPIGRPIMNAIDLSNDASRMIVGSEDDDQFGGIGSGEGRGAAYIFDKQFLPLSTTTDTNIPWLQNSKLRDTGDNATQSFFGFDVAMDGPGNTVVIGAPNYGSQGNPQIFRVTTIAKAGITAGSFFWYETVSLIAAVSVYVWYDTTGAVVDPAPVPPAGFDPSTTGIRVDISSGSIVTDVDVATATLSALNFAGTTAIQSGAVLTATTNSLNPGALSNGQLEDPVDGSTATGFTINVEQAGTDADLIGAAYIYSRDISTNTWEQEAIIPQPSSISTDPAGHGTSVSISADGTIIAVGAPGNSIGSLLTFPARVYIYTKNGTKETTQIITTAQASITENTFFWLFTSSVSYYFWYDKGTGVDPAPSAPAGAPVNTIGTVVNITADVTDIDVASTTNAAINTLGAFTANIQLAAKQIIYIENTIAEPVRNAEDGSAATGFILATFRDGSATNSVNAKETSKVFTVDFASVPAGSYFWIYSPNISYYVWYDKTGSDTDPNPSIPTSVATSCCPAAPSTKVGIRVDISGDTTDVDVGVSTRNAIVASTAAFSVTGSNELTIINESSGNIRNTEDGAVSTTFAFGTIVQGLSNNTSSREITSIETVDYATLPSGSFFWLFTALSSYYFWFDKTGSDLQPFPAIPAGSPTPSTDKIPVRVNVSGDTTAEDIAVSIKTAIDSTSSFTTTQSKFFIVVTNNITEDVADAVDGTTATTMTITTTFEGSSGWILDRSIGSTGPVGTKFGLSVDLNAEGNIIAIGSPEVGGAPTDGATAIFRNIGIWEEIFNTGNTGEAVDVKISSNGTLVAMGTVDNTPPNIVQYANTGDISTWEKITELYAFLLGEPARIRIDVFKGGIVENSAFWLATSNTSYYFWINFGTGSDPNPAVPGGLPSTKIGVEITLSTSFTQTETTSEIAKVVNSVDAFNVTLTAQNYFLVTYTARENVVSPVLTGGIIPVDIYLGLNRNTNTKSYGNVLDISANGSILVTGGEDATVSPDENSVIVYQ